MSVLRLPLTLPLPSGACEGTESGERSPKKRPLMFLSPLGERLGEGVR